MSGLDNYYGDVSDYEDNAIGADVSTGRVPVYIGHVGLRWSDSCKPRSKNKKITSMGIAA